MEKSWIECLGEKSILGLTTGIAIFFIGLTVLAANDEYISVNPKAELALVLVLFIGIIIAIEGFVSMLGIDIGEMGV